MNMSNDEQDWSSFRFPPRPPKRWDGEFDAKKKEDYSSAPNWAAPPKEVRTWHLDVDNFLIIHPIQRKKIDLNRVNTVRRLSQLSQLIIRQKDDADIASLLKALNEACVYAFNLSLPDLLSSGKKSWIWPRLDEDEYID